MMTNGIGIVVLLALMLLLAFVAWWRGWGAKLPQVLTRHYAVEVLTAILAVTMMAISISFFAAPDVYLNSHTFAVAMEVTSGPVAWGVVMGMVGLWLASALAFRDPFGLMVTSITACAVWTVWSVSIAMTTTNGLGVPGTAMAFSVLALANALASFIYAREYVERIETRSAIEKEIRHRQVRALSPGSHPYTSEDHEPPKDPRPRDSED